MKYLSLFSLLVSVTLLGQNINDEVIEFQAIKAPIQLLPEEQRFYNVTVDSPYNLTTDDVINQSKVDFQKELSDYGDKVAQSEAEYQQKLKDHEEEIKKANEKFKTESDAFEKLTLVERMVIIDQGKKPKLVVPAKPEYYKPQEPKYQDPNLDDYIIVNNQVLASQIVIQGFTRGKNNVEILINIQKVEFQDNAGQSYARQPTKLLVKVNGQEVISENYFQDFEFVSSSPTNNINKPRQEKNYLEKVMTFLNQKLNDTFAFQAENKKIKIEYVKNNKNNYDDLERAHIYVTTNLKKLQADNAAEVNKMAMDNLKKGTDIWLEALKKVNYKDSKALFNAKIGKMIYFNLMRLNVALGNKAEAEKYLNEFQENLVYLKLSYDEERELNQLENAIYKNK